MSYPGSHCTKQFLPHWRAGRWFNVVMASLLILIVLALGGLGVTAAVIVLLVRLIDSPKRQAYVPHAWPGTAAPGWYRDTSLKSPSVQAAAPDSRPPPRSR